MPPASIFTLPYELRYEIYQHYFTLDDGYTFQAGPGKLATSDGRPLDLALMYTCRLIAKEAKDLPLRFNTVSFSTVHHPEWSAWAGRFHYQLDLQLSLQSNLLMRMAHHLTPDMRSQIALKFPRFMPMLARAEEEPVPRTTRYEEQFHFELGPYRCLNSFSTGQERWEWCHENTCLVSQAVTYALRLLAQSHGPELTQLINKELPRREATQDVFEFLDKSYEPWAIPSQSVLATTGLELSDDRVWDRMNGWHKEDYEEQRYREKFRFSAVAVAIRFLNSLPSHTRLQLRKMVVHEDHISIAHPERHAQGLIPFCKENPRLRIERRVDVLNTIFQQAELGNLNSLPISSRDEPNNTRYQISYSCITEVVAHWLLGGLATVDAGMLANAFTLVLDSGRATNLCSDIFQRTVHHDLAWQTALERCYAQGILPVPSQHIPEYTFAKVPQDLWQALEHLSNQTSVLRCNFNPGQPHDVEAVFDECRTWDIHKWQKSRFFAHDQRDYDVLPPLPDWGDTLRENFEIEPRTTRNKD
ncbi:uncharacterized protein NECHADRAFT_79869 [Fusarium vanettenii 77-13-4]|uniref:Uncharacterized protein n=1 Tax=Fusarium vanettenii (strain ATCC MYA-4622 / CBS 123669 / FGSC 9596 / NRRL 45880 / 77-13-4) TaxID=660122 RepID=C7Z0F0_FUSV7|nr:uncharacterized protein NECHADRAFT_79869 [Fusarium vanettenii 77-13-4]EEU42371.1 hypothetical protein NECHADRAFT_79869 [Fusarium vanettenii 77-13-4]